MRPGRPDIAVPELPSDISWVGDPPRSMPQLTVSGPVLVHFFDFAQLNSVRAMPYLREWHRRYADAGLSVIGVQAPRFPFGADPDAVGTGLRHLGVSHPVAIDAEREMWFDYGCKGWPSLFLWGRGGALRWYHFGEGDYRATEKAIQEELREGDALRELPAPMDPVRATDAPDAAVMPPTPELFPAGEGRPFALGEGSDRLEVEYEAGGAYATIEGRGEIAATVDGELADPVRIEGAGLYELALHPRHEPHRLALEFVAGEMAIWSVSFAPGMP
ncbi:MAG: hypothetical protein M3R23_03450 [Actinomycetota bacterium]|nr:hypothetical protein [Actinomycetota bacterium]